jgi:hypothetical protein
MAALNWITEWLDGVGGALLADREFWDCEGLLDGTLSIWLFLSVWWVSHKGS